MEALAPNNGGAASKGPARRCRGGGKSAAAGGEKKKKLKMKLKKWTGVRFRLCGRQWSAELRTPGRRARLWIGTFDTPMQAALAYDAALFCFYGERLPSTRKFNFPDARRPDITEDERRDLNLTKIKAVAEKYARSFPRAAYVLPPVYPTPPAVAAPLVAGNMMDGMAYGGVFTGAEGLPTFNSGMFAAVAGGYSFSHAGYMPQPVFPAAAPLEVGNMMNNMAYDLVPGAEDLPTFNSGMFAAVAGDYSFSHAGYMPQPVFPAAAPLEAGNMMNNMAYDLVPGAEDLPTFNSAEFAAVADYSSSSHAGYMPQSGVSAAAPAPAPPVAPTADVAAGAGMDYMLDYDVGTGADRLFSPNPYVFAAMYEEYAGSFAGYIPQPGYPEAAPPVAPTAGVAAGATGASATTDHAYMNAMDDDFVIGAEDCLFSFSPDEFFG